MRLKVLTGRLVMFTRWWYCFFRIGGGVRSGLGIAGLRGGGEWTDGLCGRSSEG